MKLRDYQVNINNKSVLFFDDSTKTRGQVYAPTGAGKTVCFIHLIEHAINQGAKSIAIAHPRIALSQDQLTRIENYFGDTVHYTSFHSGKNPTKAAIKGVNTTNAQVLSKVIGQVASKPHITLSSYHSFNNLNEAGVAFDLIICDEAHYCVDPQFAKLLGTFNSNKVIFYTATPMDKEDAGMSTHLDLFGEVIAEVTPKELIKPGYIVAPMIQWLDCSTDRASDPADIVDITKRAYVEQQRLTSNWGLPYHQMLVVARDVKNDLTDNIETQENMLEIKSYIASETGISPLDLDIYTISASGTYCNGTAILSRAEALDRIKSTKRNAIVCHYDTLSEGIDIDTLSGCVVLRELGKAKFIQTVGRCARPYSGDMINGEPRHDLYDPDMMRDNRTKPRCIVTVPVVDGEVIAGPKVDDMITAFIYGGYGSYDDILSLIQSPIGRTGVGNDEDDAPKLYDPDEVIYSTVVSHTVRTSFEDLNALLFGV